MASFDGLGYYNKDYFRQLPESMDSEKIIPAYSGYSDKAWSHVYPENEDSSNATIINSVLIDPDIQSLNTLEELLGIHYPCVKISSRSTSLDIAMRNDNFSTADLIFLGQELSDYHGKKFFAACQKDQVQSILMTEKEQLDINILQWSFTGYLLKPFKESRIISVVKQVQQKILFKRDYFRCKKLLGEFNIQNSQQDSIGIPTSKGYEFVPISSIISCSGMQKCTDIITTLKKRIISSYNIGEFRKMLQPYGFFSPHKSFLINLSKVAEYHKEGTLTMSNGHHIPLARRRKDVFFKRIRNNQKFPIIPQI